MTISMQIRSVYHPGFGLPVSVILSSDEQPPDWLRVGAVVTVQMATPEEQIAAAQADTEESDAERIARMSPPTSGEPIRETNDPTTEPAPEHNPNHW